MDLNRYKLTKIFIYGTLMFVNHLRFTCFLNHKSLVQTVSKQYNSHRLSDKPEHRKNEEHFVTIVATHITGRFIMYFHIFYLIIMNLLKQKISNLYQADSLLQKLY